MPGQNDNIFLLIVLSIAGSLLLSAGAVYLFIAYQRRVVRQKEEMQQAAIVHQKELLEAVITSQEAERKRIGMDLHDEVGAALSTLRMKIDQYAGQDRTNDGFPAGWKTDIDRIVANMRNIAHSLSPRIAGPFGFHDAVHELSDQVNKTGIVQMAVDFAEEPQPVFSNTQAPMALYRVITELVNNTLKHAGASVITLVMKTGPEELHIRYTDDGKGLPPAQAAKKPGMGMQNIESRLGIIAAAWKFDSQPGGGYGITISVPLQNKHADDTHSIG